MVQLESLDPHGGDPFPCSAFCALLKIFKLYNFKEKLTKNVRLFQLKIHIFNKNKKKKKKKKKKNKKKIKTKAKKKKTTNTPYKLVFYKI